MSAVPLISIVDDGRLRVSRDNLSRPAGFRVDGLASAEAFWSSNRAHETNCLVLDVRLALVSGLELQVRSCEPSGESRSSSTAVQLNDLNLQEDTMTPMAGAFLA